MTYQENAALRYRVQLIDSINTLKIEAIRLGFDYPTQDITDIKIPLKNLVEFQQELADFISAEIQEESSLWQEILT